MDEPGAYDQGESAEHDSHRKGEAGTDVGNSDREHRLHRIAQSSLRRRSELLRWPVGWAVGWVVGWVVGWAAVSHRRRGREILVSDYILSFKTLSDSLPTFVGRKCA